MDSEQAHTIIRQTFENPFNKESYVRFVKNLLNRIEYAPFTYQGQFIPDAYKPYVSVYERIGKYNDGENRIDILIVYLKRETSIERARTRQRNFVAGYLQGKYGSSNEKEAALVAFVSQDEADDWRFSLVKMDYRFEKTPTGRMKAREEFTPARRWSFLVGANENSHTAQIQLVPIIENDEHNPTLAELEQAFNIETVTREFFEKYRELFLRAKETLDSILSENKTVKTEFATTGVNTVDFTKKLLGQIVFLYFLQKKGWFGVARDADWGTGPRNFLRELFEGKHGTYRNFFNDILEPLFYEALARERDGDFYRYFNCKIPFLNGGLFDPIGGYDWVHTDILLPDDLFSNEKRTKEGDTGNGILNIFDRYNFTVKEDEPLEKEVAVDPEMLGKVFENLLEVKDRKSKGTYYTPREIVHYMCRQSLVNYLYTELNGKTAVYEKIGEEQLDMFGNKVKRGQLDLTIERTPGNNILKEDIEMLIRIGEHLGENEAIAIEKEQRIIEGKQKSSIKKPVLPESIRHNAQLIDGKLAAIKVCDPAVGSGAFLVGMMSEIVRARNVLSVFIKEPDRSPYRFKRECIEKSLYGVDIDPGATEITKLRLWLSLVVDEEDIQEIKPLPNLDYKIVCGNSLGNITWDVWDNNLFKELGLLKNSYFDETNPRQKQKKKVRIDALIAKLTNDNTIFNYHIHFGEVFDHSDGFDVVMANPPYVRQEGIKDLKPSLKNEFGKFFCGTADLYTYFYKRGIEILKAGGHLCFIAPNKFMRAGYGKNTRQLLAQTVTLKTIIDFGELPVFEAGTDPAIVLVEKNKSSFNDKCISAIIKAVGEINRVDEVVKERGFDMLISSLSTDGWTLERPQALALIEKLRKAGMPLGEYVKGRFYYGIKTGLNEAFVIDEATQSRLISEDPKSAELIKPWLRGRDIKKWKAQWAGLYVIFTRRGTDIERYPAIKRYLEQFRADLEPKKTDKDKRGRKPGSYQWFEIQDNIAYYEEFNKAKIIYADIAKLMRASYDTKRAFCANTLYILPTDDLSLLGILHSKLFDWYARQNFQALGDPWKGGRLRFIAQYMELFPLPLTTNDQKSSIITLVDRILANPNSPDVTRLETEIDHLVYQLYNLTYDEVKIIDPGFPLNKEGYTM